MDHVMVFDEKEKKKIGLIALLPNICFFLTLVYYLILIMPLARGHVLPASIVALTHANYTTLFFMLAISAIVSACVLIYELVLLARVKNMNGAAKGVWVVFMATFVPISLLAFWYFVIRKEPKYVGVHHDII
jgi:hypothetical protein